MKFTTFSCCSPNFRFTGLLSFDSEVIDILYFVLSWMPPVAADNHGPGWTYKFPCASNLVLNFPLFCRSVEPKVRLQGYGYNPFCSHSSRCLAVLVWQYFEEAFCAPKVRLKWYGFKGSHSHSSHCSGGLFPQYSGVSPVGFPQRRPWHVI